MSSNRMRPIVGMLLSPLAFCAVQTHAAEAAVAGRCMQLAEAMRGQWPDATSRILQATWRAAGSTVAMPFGPPVSLPAHCEVTGIMQERVGIDGLHYAIRFHVRLPERWNGGFLFQGGGGSEGVLGDAIGMLGIGTPSGLARGYAVVSEDAGHDNTLDSVPARGGPIAFGFDPTARANYGGASLEPVARAAKALIRTLYGRPARHSYFYGCSKGGQEGMAFAQRDPDEFDGIVAAAPGFSLPRAAVAEAWDTQAFGSLVSGAEEAGTAAESFDARRMAGTFSDAQFALVRSAVLEVCDADDGARDGITADFGRCTWPRVERELDRRLCPAGPPRAEGGPAASATGAGACLQKAQIEVLERVYGGPKNRRGEPLYSDWPLDAGIGSAGWRSWKIGAGAFPGINVAMGAPSLAEVFTTPPTAVPADPQSALRFALRFDFDRDAPRIYATGGAFQRSAWTDISARSPHLEAFRAHGGKMIVPQGASDPVFSLNDTLAWYREVEAIEHGSAANFVRVFPVPGMAHCAGGPATDEFDAFGALVSWVEKGHAPDRMLAKAGPATPWPRRTRPLCPYPRVARYSGSGSIEDAANFRCE